MKHFCMMSVVAVVVGCGEEEPQFRGKPASFWATALANQDTSLGVDPVDALVAIGPSSVPHLADALDHKDVRVREAASKGLVMLGQCAEPAVPELIEALADEHPPVCRNAAEALGEIGPAAKSAIPALLAARRSRDEHLASKASTALVRIKVTEAAELE